MSSVYREGHVVIMSDGTLRDLPPLKLMRRVMLSVQGKRTYVGAYGLLIEHGVILLAHKQWGPYASSLDLPGGGVEFGEDPVETVQREFLEESGLAVTASGFMPPFSHVVDGKHHLGFIFSMVRAGHGRHDPGNSLETVWMPVSSLPERRLSPLVHHAMRTESLLSTIR